MAVMSPLGSCAHWQLAHTSTPPPVLAELARRAVGSGIDRIDRILDGYSNEVYRVRCTDQQDVVIRILRFDDGDLAASSASEPWAVEQARAAGVPVPEILLVDTVRIDAAEFPVMVQRAVPGRPLGAVIKLLSPQQRHSVLTEIGALVARMNGIHVDGGTDWPTAMTAELAARHADRDKVLAGGFSGFQFDRTLDLLEGYVRNFPCQQRVLCHGDLSLKHIFVSLDGHDGAAVRVSGIIDFGDWQPGAPVHDLAVLRVREPQLDLSPILTGYGSPSGETYRRQLDLHTLTIALGSLAFCVDELDQPGIQRSRDQIRALVADLDAPCR